MANDKVAVEQKVARGGTANGVVNNYYGMQPADVHKVVTDLFEKNFPKLQEEAMKKVMERVNELQDTFLMKLSEHNIKDLSAIADPDVQYIINKAQTEYARNGTKDSLETLTSLIIQRMQQNDDTDWLVKSAIDDAIEISTKLNASHFDTLSLVFIDKHKSDTRIIGKQKAHDSTYILMKYAEIFIKASKHTFSVLSMYNCYCREYGRKKTNSSASDSHTSLLHFIMLILRDTFTSMIKSLTFNILGKDPAEQSFFDCLPDNFNLTPIGTVLAIVNINNKASLNLNISDWIEN